MSDTERKQVRALIVVGLALGLLGLYAFSGGESPPSEAELAAIAEQEARQQEARERDRQEVRDLIAKQREARGEDAPSLAELREQNRKRQSTPRRNSIAVWSTINFVDEFGDGRDRGAVSATVGSVRSMSFPYSDTTATIMVNCDRAWMRFSESPNLTGGSIKDGYTDYSVAVRVDERNVGRRTVRQQWGGKDLRFVDGREAVAALSAGSEFAVSLPWYGQNSSVFSWSLSGSSEMISRSCN